MSGRYKGYKNWNWRIGMKKNQYKQKSKYGKKIVIFCELLVLFLFIGSTIAVAASESSEKSAAAVPSLASENPEFVKYQKNPSSPQPDASIGGRVMGYTPAPLDRRHFHHVSSAGVSLPAYYSSQDLQGTSTVSATQSGSFNPYYDLRTQSKVTSVKDQGSAGVCWAFATYGSLESCLMPGENLDFSENNLKNLLSSAYPQGFDRSANGGGNELMSTAYLARWSGPVAESADPYNSKSVDSPQNLPVQKHVQNVLFIPDRSGSLDNNEVKSAVLSNGALFTCMYYDSTRYNTTSHCYYYNGSSASNHAVVVVGWDDNFDKKRFKTTPPGNGAFIIKNSWGTGYGEKGYFYVSYYDSNIGKNNAIFTAENLINYNNIYQYDPLGFVASTGFNSPTAWCANIFTAKSNEVLKAVSFYTTDSNCNYEIYINNNSGSKPLSQTGLIPNQRGTIQYAGYYTVNLPGIPISAGKNFSVVLKLTTPNNNYPIPVERPISQYSSKATASSGQSFISNNGITWTDITTRYRNTNVCIKAFS
jgi:C1A family cysteine protease